MNIFLLSIKFIYFLLIQIIIIYSYQYIYYKNRLFPANTVDRQITFTLPSSSSNSTDINNTNINNTNNNNTNINTCIASSQGDFFCDSTNNNEYCLYDGGDCCQGTCRENCAKRHISNSDCICGTNSYNCISQNTSCYNCKNGKCEKNMSKCYSDDEYILTAIQSCILNSFSQGNENTSNFYCGTDHEFSSIHGSDPSSHFPGCGIDKVNCTELPCCEVVKLNRDTNKNCNYTENLRFIYNENTLQYEIKNISCMEYYRSCFQKNAKGKSRGQCCQCYEGWGGTYCDVPLCENCIHGKCVDVNKCECDENYTGPNCNIPICDECVHGVCIKPNECECFYGYTGKRCDVVVTYPFCIHGVEKKGDKCECNEGFYGKLCEIKICDEGCDFCDDDGNCYEDLSKKCEVIDPNCLKCENEKCLECKSGYILQDINGDSFCSVFDNCLKGNSTMCTECDYPYVLNDDKNKCVFGGIVEIGQKYFDVMLNKNIEEFNIDFYLFYSSGDLICSVNYEIFPVFNNNNLDYTNNSLDYFPNKKGILTFDKNETKKNIILPVFNFNKYFKIQNNENLQNVFFINIYNPKGGCIIGEVNYSYLEIFDDERNYENNIFFQKNLNINITNDLFDEENNLYDFYSDSEEINFELSYENFSNENEYFILISVSDNFNSKININLNFENIKYKFLKDDEENNNKKINFYLCYNKSKLFNISFFNYPTLMNIKNDFSPFFIRINNSLNIDYYYIENNKTFYSFLFEFYFKIPENNFYLKIVLNKNDFVVLLINNIEIKLNSSEISNEILNNIYLIKIEDFNLKSNFLKINIKFIHLYENNYFNVFYSENNVNYVNINDCNLNIYSCQIYKTFNINLS